MIKMAREEALTGSALNELKGSRAIGIGLCPRSLKDRHLTSNQDKCRFESCRGFGEINEKL